MSIRVDAHPIFYTNREPPAYHAAIRLSEEHRKQLIAASEKARTAIRDKFKAGFELLTKGANVALYESSVARASMRGISSGAHAELVPRFLRQGSVAYNLALEPCYPLVQEVDIDDGVYFPMSFVEGNRPALTVEGMFLTVENALKELCASEGWILLDSNHPKRKSNCVRILLGDGAHLDLPLYAIPNDQFVVLEKNMKAAMEAHYSLSQAINKHPIDPDSIQLAHRDEGWVLSDPRILNDWFKNQKSAFSELSAVCRYLKGWRDFTWPNGGPSSICLMACAVAALKTFDSSQYQSRHDLLMLEVSAALPKLFLERIPNPALKNGDGNLDSGWDAEGMRTEYVEKAQKFSDDLSSALTRTADRNEIVRKLTMIFGNRIPSAFWNITIGGSATASVMATEPDKQPLAQVTPHISA
ncbi:MAG: CBASS cGAMP synthase [Alphaproteobacteria bacterium]